MANSLHDLINSRINGRTSVTIPTHVTEDATKDSWLEKGPEAWKKYQDEELYHNGNGTSVEDYAWTVTGNVLAKYKYFKENPAAALTWLSDKTDLTNKLTDLISRSAKATSIATTANSIVSGIDLIRNGELSGAKGTSLSGLLNMSGKDAQTLNWGVSTLRSVLSKVSSRASGADKGIVADKGSVEYWRQLFEQNPSDYAHLIDTYLPMDYNPSESKTPQDGFKYGITRTRDEKYKVTIPISKEDQKYDSPYKDIRESLEPGELSDGDFNSGILNRSLVFDKEFLDNHPRIKANYFDQTNPDQYYKFPEDKKATDFNPPPQTSTTSRVEDKLDNKVSFQSIIESMRADGFLSGYTDFAGFEIGSDHQWKVEIYPYPYELDDIERYKNLGRNSCTPPLPCYLLPNLWGNVREKNHHLTIDTDVATYQDPDLYPPMTIEDTDPVRSNKRFKMNYLGTEASTRSYVQDSDSVHLTKSKVSLPSDYRSLDNSVSAAPVIFSFSKNPPIMSYSLNLGTMNSESLPLFGGSTVPIFSGMTYSMTLTLDFVDDVYGSMDKYMLHYLNCVEDKYNNSRAPYYNCAFYIKLKIFMAGGKLKQSLNLIAVPITYTPSYQGQQDANEARISITYGIIGYKPPVTASNADNKRNSANKGVGDIQWRYGHPGQKIYQMPPDRYAEASKEDKNHRYGDLRELSWGDIRLNAGNVSTTWDKVK